MSTQRIFDVACITIGAVSVVLAALVMFTPLADKLNRRFALRPKLEPADAIVVLAASGVRPDGSLADDSVRRMMKGIELYRKGLAPVIVFSGGPSLEGHVEADVRSRLAVLAGIPAAAILTETRARTTQGEAANISATLGRKNARRILLVVDGPGTRRAAMLFEKRGLRALPAPTEDPSGRTLPPEHRLRLVRQLALEATALSYYLIAGYL